MRAPTASALKRQAARRRVLTADVKLENNSQFVNHVTHPINAYIDDAGSKQN